MADGASVRARPEGPPYQMPDETTYTAGQRARPTRRRDDVRRRPKGPPYETTRRCICPARGPRRTGRQTRRRDDFGPMKLVARRVSYSFPLTVVILVLSVQRAGVFNEGWRPDQTRRLD